MGVWLYTIGSVLLVSIVSFTGAATLSIEGKKLKKVLIYLVSFAAGALFGDAFLHLLPEVIEENGFSLTVSISIIAGIVLFFVLEKIISWHHYHMPHSGKEVHSFAITSLAGDAMHNFIDGLIIAASYLISIPVGIATTIAVVLHEIPQEIGDFGILLQGGFTKNKALLFNFLTALTAVMGAVLALLLGSRMENITLFLVPFAAGGFIYVAGADLIPELHKEVNVKKSIFQLSAFIAGIGVMMLLLLIE